MPNMPLNKKLLQLTKEELVDGVRIRLEGDHFRVTSGRGWHTIKYTKDDVAHCTCEDWTYQRGDARNKCCKHLAAMGKIRIVLLNRSQKRKWNIRQYKNRRTT